MDKEFVSGLPLTDAECWRDAEAKRETSERQYRRRKAAPSQNYNKPGSREVQRSTNRMLGERE